ncbi:hypothetical protein VCA_000288 [Vibrio albensis VL426]|nr:hypothetical protein VCA_000288 [Vibrio cholerae VL426]
MVVNKRATFSGSLAIGYKLCLADDDFAEHKSHTAG